MVPITDFVANNHGKKPAFASSLFTNRCYGFGIESDHPIEDQRRKNCFKSNNNVGTLTNFHPILLNILVENNEKYKDNLLSRYKDPGAGAFTYQLGETWRASMYIEAGEEMYIDYGEDWFFEYKLGDKDKDSPEHKIPRVKDYAGAAKMVEVFIDSFEKRNKTLLWDITQEELDKFQGWLINREEGIKVLHRQLINLAIGKNLQSFKDFVKSIDESEIRFPKKKALWRIARVLALRSNLHDRDVSWIKANGRCLDNIYPSVSSIPQAGQGAFATRNIPKGQVIVPIPLTLVVVNRNVLNLYKHEYISGQLKSIGDAYSKQLLVNYCFSDGRGRSSMLLCGQSTNANLINHCSARLEKNVGQCNPSKGPNAILRWATDFDPDTLDWLKQDIRTINDRVVQEKRGLTLEVVALRTIQRNEEIMIDYGPSWEEAWKEHVAKWRPPTNAAYTHDDGSSDTRFVPVSDMNLDKEKYLLTKADLAAGRTYPHKNVRIGCYVTNTYHPCNILTKSNDGWYTVLIYPFQNANQDALGKSQRYTWPFNKEDAISTLQSRDIKFFAGPYSSDHYLEGVFRHHIGVPDEIWPEHWRNIKSRKQKIRPMRNITSS